jgi:alpha/beta superfamily hydrolase
MESPAPARRVAASSAIEIEGPAGSIEAAVDSVDAAPRAIAVVCHPHPLQQGTMQNKVVTTLARSFAHLGAAAVRFNFRGVGRSQGRHDEGRGERDDVLAVVRFARERWPGRPLYLGGFSFGGAMALAAAHAAAPRGLVTVAPSIARLPADFVPPACRWLLVHGGADDVVAPQPVLDWAARLAAPPTVVLVEGVGHFFHGRLRDVTDAVTSFFGAELEAEKENPC